MKRHGRREDLLERLLVPLLIGPGVVASWLGQLAIRVFGRGRR